MGKSNSVEAIKEPIKINHLHSEKRFGLGSLTLYKETKERQMSQLKRKINANDMNTDQYRKQMRGISDKKQTLWDLHKLQRTCRLLDIDNRVSSPIHSWFWPEEKIVEDNDHDDNNKEEGEISKSTIDLSVSMKINLELRNFMQISHL